MRNVGPPGSVNVPLNLKVAVSLGFAPTWYWLMTAKGLLRDGYCGNERVREENRGARTKIGDDQRERRGLREGDLGPATPRRIVEKLDRIGQRSQELAGSGRHIGQLQGLDCASQERSGATGNIGESDTVGNRATEVPQPRRSIGQPKAICDRPSERQGAGGGIRAPETLHRIAQELSDPGGRIAETETIRHGPQGREATSRGLSCRYGIADGGRAGPRHPLPLGHR